MGAALALIATNTEVSLMALLGLILLIGIVKKNAIMMIDFALDAERSGLEQGRRGHRTENGKLYGRPNGTPAVTV